MRKLTVLPALVLGILFDVVWFAIWSLFGIVSLLLGIVYGVIVILVSIIPFVPGIGLIFGLGFIVYSFGAWASLGVLPLAFLGVMNGNALIKTMHTILNTFYVRPIKSFQRQVPGPDGEVAYVTFMTDKETFFSIRKAANLAGIWFTNVRWTPSGFYFVYKVWIRESDE